MALGLILGGTGFAAPTARGATPQRAAVLDWPERIKGTFRLASTGTPVGEVCTGRIAGEDLRMTATLRRLAIVENPRKHTTSIHYGKVPLAPGVGSWTARDTGVDPSWEGPEPPPCTSFSGSAPATVGGLALTIEINTAKKTVRYAGEGGANLHPSPPVPAGAECLFHNTMARVVEPDRPPWACWATQDYFFTTAPRTARRRIVFIAATYAQARQHRLSGSLFQSRGSAGSYRWSWEIAPVGGDLQAIPGRYRPVGRGGTVHLDGRRSKAGRGRIVSYRWTFTPGTGCPPGTLLKRASRSGARVAVKLLCPLVATLIVTDSRGRTASAETSLGVLPRRGAAWTTTFSHRDDVASTRGPTAPPTVLDLGDAIAVRLTGGVNTTDCGEEAPGSMILCPTIGGRGSWRGKGYELTRLSDPGGPFDGFWYVGSSSIEVKRVAYLNPTLLPGSAFYEENARLGNPVAGFIEAIAQHEGYGRPGVDRSGHTQIIRDLVTGDDDPRRAIEQRFASSERAAQQDVDDALHDIDHRVDLASDDPLPQIWSSGPLAFWDEASATWVTAPTFHVP